MNLKRLKRIILFYIVVISGIITTITGFVLYFWPKGPRAGKLLILGCTKGFWKDLHTWVTIFTFIVILLHLIENRKAIKLYIKETLK